MSERNPECTYISSIVLDHSNFKQTQYASKRKFDKLTPCTDVSFYVYPFVMSKLTTN